MIIVCTSFTDTLLKYLIFAEVNMLQLRRQDRIYAGAEVNHCQCFAKIYVVHFIYWDVRQEHSIGGTGIFFHLPRFVSLWSESGEMIWLWKGRGGFLGTWNSFQTRLTYNCAHLRSTKESLTILVKFFGVEIFLGWKFFLVWKFFWGEGG